jgi:hypothetical protein
LQRRGGVAPRRREAETSEHLADPGGEDRITEQAPYNVEFVAALDVLPVDAPLAVQRRGYQRYPAVPSSVYVSCSALPSTANPNCFRWC